MDLSGRNTNTPLAAPTDHVPTTSPRWARVRPRTYHVFPATRTAAPPWSRRARQAPHNHVHAAAGCRTIGPTAKAVPQRTRAPAAHTELAALPTNLIMNLIPAVDTSAPRAAARWSRRATDRCSSDLTF
eukprot:1480623-Prymnesium_polylepis.1